MFIAALFLIALNWKQNSQTLVYSTREYHSAITSNELLIHAVTWMDLKGIRLSEKSQSQKVIYFIIPFI